MIIGVDDLRRVLELLLAARLVAQNAVRQVGNVHAGQRVHRVGQQLGVFFRVVQIGDGGADVRRAAQLQVGRNRGQLLRVARD